MAIDDFVVNFVSILRFIEGSKALSHTDASLNF